MKVSVVIPSLDSSAYIGEAVSSALAQPLPDLEVVVQDGGSSDRTIEILEGFDDPRVSVRSGPDNGLYDALNRGVQRTRGEWVLCLNSDDLLARDALGHIEPILSSDWEFICGDFEQIDAEGHLEKLYLGSELSRQRLLKRGCYLFTGSMLIRRGLFERFGRFDPRYRYCADYDFLLRIAGRVRAIYVSEVLARFRLHGSGLTDRHGWGFFSETLEVRRRQGGFRGSTAVPAALNQLRAGAYVATKPLWLSPLWRRWGPSTKRQ